MLRSIPALASKKKKERFEIKQKKNFFLKIRNRQDGQIIKKLYRLNTV